MPGPAGATREMISRVIRDAMTKMKPERDRLQHGWSNLPTIGPLVQSFSEQSRQSPVESTHRRETDSIPPGSTAFKEFIGSGPRENQGSGEAGIDQTRPYAQIRAGEDRGSVLSTPGGRLEITPPTSTSLDPLASSANERLQRDSGWMLKNLGSFVNQIGKDEEASGTTLTPLEPSRFGFGDPGPAFSSGVGEIAPASGSPSSHRVGKVLSSVGTIAAASPLPTVVSPLLDLARLSSSSGVASPFIGDPAGPAVGGPGGMTSSQWWANGSRPTSNNQGYPDSSPASLSPVDPSTGQGADLTRTNELLEQLLDEYRKSQQSYLPLNDRNSSLI